LKIVVRLGGSILGSPPDASIVRSYSAIVSELSKRKHRMIIVVGGGGIARQYIEAARNMGLSHEDQDMIAIGASRLNARLVGMSLGIDKVALTPEEAISNVRRRPATVMGGLKPGITTDTVAAIVAEAWGSDLIVKASDQDGIYTADPRKNPSAKLLQTVPFTGAVEILAGEHSPGIHSIVDPVAMKRIAKNKLRLVVVNGNQPGNVLRAVAGEKVGTLVA
jgi:uridylate kinase